MQQVRRYTEHLDKRENTMEKDYEDIPGTFVFDADRSREGYHLNQFCISLRLQKNRDAFNADEEAYLDKFPMTADQRDAVLKRDWNRLLELGGNIYYTSKLAANDGINFQNLAGLMTGMGVEAYRKMMLEGGRPIEGNRFKSEWENK
jgi:protocatechuate 4,5-dioxygenase alpha subunit (EC 1.13.11.8)